ncbi:MAG: hypothetical protein KDC71_23770, partial [Acidobacteria bacterium]|nr:hypothetical protein [Acidobacteriota bacterium]
FGRLLGADAESIENGTADYNAIEFEPFTWLFAAYVNENHPGVQKILKQALEAEIVPNFAGYLGNADAGAVIQQVFAIWNVLQRNGVKYSNITSNESEDVTLFSQHVRFLDEVVDNTQANCVDGTVLFASVLRKIGIQPYLILAPGHMYLAFSLDGTDESLVGLETTLMGSTTLKSVGYNQQLTHEMREQMKNEASWAAFEGAIDYGSKALSEALAAINKSNDPRYQIVSIALARKMGIMPIAFSQP